MAKKKNYIRHFTVGENEYTEIGDDIYLVIGRWGNYTLLVYNEKSKPSWSETNFVESEIIKGGNGYYFIHLPSNRRTFLGINTKGTFFQFFHWIFSELKLEVPVQILSQIAEEESLNLTHQRKRPSLPLLSEVCKYTWFKTNSGKNDEDKDSWCRARSAYQLLSPGGELGKKDSRNHLMVEMTSTDLPPRVLVADKVDAWKAELKTKKP
jgi:hypothetical protein